MNKHIVVWDPKNEYWEGALVASDKLPALKARGAVTLPVEEGLLAKGAGYAKRAWGAGFPLTSNVPRLACPLSMLVFREHRMIHWAARVMSDADYDAAMKNPEFRPGGMIRFVGDGSRELTHHLHITPVTPVIETNSLGPKDERNGWTINGRGEVNPHLDGHCGFALYGYAPGLRVVWLAASLVRQ